jgi:hypothetical protein
MRKHKSPATSHLELVRKKANQLRDARIDAAIVEYAEILMDWEHVDFNDIDTRISEAKAGGFPPVPRWREEIRKQRLQA